MSSLRTSCLSYHNLAMMDERSLCGDAEWNEIKRTVINSVKGSVYPGVRNGERGREGTGGRLN